nr:MAG TPA: hypothetical protein [Caudoviricetes sp.]
MSIIYLAWVYKSYKATKTSLSIPYQMNGGLII